MQIPKQFNPPGNGERDMERPLFANKIEEMFLKMLGGSGKMTEHGIPSYAIDGGYGSGFSDHTANGGTSGAGGNNSGGSSGGDRALGLTTGKVTGTKAYGAAGGTAVGNGAPGYGTPAETAATLARLRPRTPVAPVVTQPVVKPPIPRVKPAVPSVIPPNFMGPIGNVPGPVGPQIGGTTLGEMMTAAINAGQPSTTPSATPGSGYGAPGGSSNPANDPSNNNGGDQFGHSLGAPDSPASPFGGGRTGFGGNAPAPGGLDRYADDTGGGKFGAGSTQTGAVSPGGLDRFADTSTGGKFGAGSTQTGAVSPSGVVKDQSRLPGTEGPTPAPSYDSTVRGEYTQQALNDFRHNNGWIPDPVDAPRPMNGVAPSNPAPGNVRTIWDWSGLGQMDGTGTTVTPRPKPDAVFGGQGIPSTMNDPIKTPKTAAGGLMKSLGRVR